MYCTNKNQAVVRWSFGGQTEKLFVANRQQLPIKIDISEIPYYTQNVGFDFDGTVITSYGFTINSPAGFPKDNNFIPEIYLLYGKWDDHGTIGNYNTGYGLVLTYSGAPLLIGRGFSVSGSVVNEIATQCYVRFNLGWGLGVPSCKFTISSQSQILLNSFGASPVNFNVSCDDECPAGYLRCETSEYPGYSCIPCSEIQSQIAAMRNNIRRLK